MTIIVAYIVLVNIVGYSVFAWDKHCARCGSWRVPERDLLALAAMGGTIGLIIGQRILRHKTRKEPFRSRLFGIAGVQVFLLIAVSFV